MPVDANGMPAGVANQQTINGKNYTQYTPEWYAAMDADKTRQAVAAGTAIGSGTKAAYDAMGNPTDTSSSTGSGSLAGIAAAIPRIGAGGTGGAGSPTGTYDTGGGGLGTPASVAPISAPDMAAANSATFGRAKDQVGQETSGALTGLRSALASRGMLGSAAESRGTVSAITKGQGELGDVSRDIAQNEANQNLDIAKTNYAGDISQRGQDITTRGQDITHADTNRGQDITQRGQDIQQQEANASLQMTQSLQQAAQRQAVLNGIMSAISSKSLY